MGSEVQRVQAPVIGVATPLDITAFLKVVEERHHSAWQQAEVAAERLLALAGLDCDGSYDAGLRGRQPFRRDPFGEHVRGVLTDLRKQERNTTGTVISGPRRRHRMIVPFVNRWGSKALSTRFAATISGQSSIELGERHTGLPADFSNYVRRRRIGE